MVKPCVLVLNRYYLPGFKAGGPVTSLRNLLDALSSDFQFKIITFDRDLGDSEPYTSVKNGCWTTFEGVDIYYMQRSAFSLSRISKLIREVPHDILYLNGYFSFETTVIPLLAKRMRLINSPSIIMAPRGCFTVGALSINRWKKMICLFFTCKLGLHKQIVWQASSDFERADIHRIIGRKATVKIAKDLPSAPREFRCIKLSLEHGLKLVFLSRVTPMKNLKYALEVLALCKAKLEFSIYGPVEDEGYWELCRKQICNLPNNVKVIYNGAVPPSNVVSILSQYHLMFLPTKGENYGHVISESIAGATPVLISDTTPWTSFPLKVGKVLPLSDKTGFSQYIDEFSLLSEAEMFDVRNRVKQYCRMLFSDSSDAMDNRMMFKDMLQKF